MVKSNQNFIERYLRFTSQSSKASSTLHFTPYKQPFLLVSCLSFHVSFYKVPEKPIAWLFNPDENPTLSEVQANYNIVMNSQPRTQSALGQLAV